ncbi:unnamed protein product [Closterium sp. Yama58-4]|nr:unnamed protein product [Closterium sp. Yama58-4]
MVMLMMLPVSASSSSSSSSASASEASSLVAKPLARKFKTVEKYVAKMRPTVLKGKVIGCKGASGKMVMKVVRYSATNYQYSFTVNLMKLQNGGALPASVGYATACTGRTNADMISWHNLTTDKQGRAKRYSFQGFAFSGGPLADVHRCSC